MKLPHAIRPLKSEYVAVANLLKDDLYLDMSETEFVANMMKLAGGGINPTRAQQIYLNLMKDAGFI
jgi:hypothetical protein